MTSTLSEDEISDAFHSYLKSSLAQAKAEKLLDTDLLASAEADLMITGPALCLYFAALRCTTDPPSVPLPRNRKGSAASSNSVTASTHAASPPMDLSFTNCPPAFVSFLAVWARTVPLIQSLQPQHQHDLARIICNLPTLALYSAEDDTHDKVTRIAHELRAVAIEIGQRRSFQERYTDDLQAAIDAGEAPSGAGIQVRPSAKANFVPPPMYDAAPSYYDAPPQHPQHPPPPPPRPVHLPPTQPLRIPHRHTGQAPPSPSPGPRPVSPSILQNSPAISLIRETLYASLGDVMSSSPYIRHKLKAGAGAGAAKHGSSSTSDMTRVYFAAMGLAILDVSSRRTRMRPNPNSNSNSNPYPGTPPEPVVTGVLDAELTAATCPSELRPFMMELVRIGVEAREMEEEDSERMVKALSDPHYQIQNGHHSEGMSMPRPRMDRVRRMIERGIQAEDASSSSSSTSSSDSEQPQESAHLQRSAQKTLRRRPTSPGGRALMLANRVNGLALGMMKLRAFRERQGEVFGVLRGVR